MALPQAVQQASDEAEALQAQLYAVPPAAPEGQTDEPEVVAEPVSNVVELPKEAPPVPVETPRAEPTEDAGYWKQKFSTLQGKFNAEVPQLHQQLREQGQQLTRLTDLLETKQTPAENAAPQDSNDADEYGSAWVETVDRRARTMAQQLVAQEMTKLRLEIGAMKEQVGQVSEQVQGSALDKFWTEVMTLVPDWKQLDTSPEWIGWLDSTPEFSEDTYRSMATKAVQRGDAVKIAGLVKQFRGFSAAAPFVPPVVPAIDPELLRQVTPSTTRASAPVTPPGRIWTAAEYQQAMDVRNVQRFGEAEASKMEKEANLAVAEGRVRWG